MELKHIKNLSENVAELRLDGEIGIFPLIGSDIAAEIKFIDRTGVDQLNVIINSHGGNVSDGFSIFSALIRAKAKIVVEIDFMAASMAGIVAMAGDVIKMVDFGIFMIHDPSFGDPDIDAANRDILEKTKKSLLTVLVKRSAIEDAEELDELMTRETFFEADEALSQGLVDEIIPTTAREAAEVENIKELIMNKASLAEIYNSAKEQKPENKTITNQQNIVTMKGLNAHLKLQDAANEDQQISAIKEIETERDTAVGKVEAAEKSVTEKDVEIKDLEKELETAKEAGKDTLETAAKASVDADIKAGKFEEEKREELEKIAIDSPDMYKTMSDSMKAGGPKGIDDLTDLPADDGKGGDAGDGAESITDTEKLSKLWDKMQEDPTGKQIQNLLDNKPEQYKKIYNAKYGKDPVMA